MILLSTLVGKSVKGFGFFFHPTKYRVSGPNIYSLCSFLRCGNDPIWRIFSRWVEKNHQLEKFTISLPPKRECFQSMCRLLDLLSFATLTWEKLWEFLKQDLQDRNPFLRPKKRAETQNEILLFHLARICWIISHIKVELPMCREKTPGSDATKLKKNNRPVFRVG